MGLWDDIGELPVASQGRVIQDLLIRFHALAIPSETADGADTVLGANSSLNLTMKVNDPNPSSLGAAGSATPSPAGAAKSQKSQEIERTPPGVAPAGASTSPVAGDDVHLSELVRSLRSLAADSPERQAHLEQIARTYAAGAYNVDAPATASKIIDDALEP